MNWTLSDHNGQQPILPGLFAGQMRTHRMPTPHDLALNRAHQRLMTMVMLFSLGFLIVSGRVTYLATSNLNQHVIVQEQNGDESVTIRADVIDRNGEVLATSLPTVSLCGNAKKIPDLNDAVGKIASVFPDLDEEKLLANLQNGKSCVSIKRHITPKQQMRLNQLGIAGVEYQPDERRVYPLGEAAVHVVGFTNIDNEGLAGIEHYYDNALHTRSSPAVLSLDTKVQSLMRQELQKSMQEFSADGAAGLVMDVGTGEILSLVSLPDFNPQQAGKATDDARFNRATLGVYEMGSTFKIFNSALALNTNTVRLSDSFDATHPLEIGRFSIKDFHSENRWLNVAEIFVHSSNIGSALMAEKVGSEKQKAFFGKLGLMEKAKLEISEVGAPLMPKPSNWNDTTVKTAAFGHGIAVNAVQLAAGVATLLNDGVPIHPTLLKTDPDAHIFAKPEQPIISKKTAAQIRALMRLVVTRGTGKAAESVGFMVGGKTGTADKIDKNGRYNSHKRLSSFIGAFPMNNPRYVVYVMLDDPKGTAKTGGYATGGMVAAPLAGKLIRQIGPLLNVSPMNALTEAAAEKQLMKPLGSVMVDGSPVQEGLSYASVATDHDD